MHYAMFVVSSLRASIAYTRTGHERPVRNATAGAAGRVVIAATFGETAARGSA